MTPAEVVAQRGPEFDLDCFFNDRRVANRQDLAGLAPTPQRVREALPLSVFRWIGTSDAPASRLYIQVDDVPDTIRLNIFADTHHLSPADAEALVRETEMVAVEAAADTDVRASAGRRYNVSVDRTMPARHRGAGPRLRAQPTAPSSPPNWHTQRPPS